MNLPIDDNLTEEHTKNDTRCEYTDTFLSANGLSSKEGFECSDSSFTKLQSSKLFDSFTEKTDGYNSDSTDVFVKSNVETSDPSSFLSGFCTDSSPAKNSIDVNNSFLNDLEAEKQLSSGVMTSQNNLESKSVTLEISKSTNLPADEPENAITFECQKINWIYSSPKVIACADSEFRLSEKLPSHDNYLRGCLWSPDGSCILTNSHDNILRLFNLPSSILANDGGELTLSEPEEMKSVLRMHEKELIYDYCWYPLMCSNDPVSCCFASTSRRNPIRLWDAFSGIIRATYTPINHLGEVVSASSLSFSSNGLRLYAGFHRYIQVFDVSRPGSDSIRRPKLGKKPIQGGIISCIGVLNDPSRNIYATGSYNGTVCIFSEPVWSHSSDIDKKTFAGKNGSAPWYVLVGGRMDSRIFVWDARNLINPITIIHRRIENHQKFQFDVEPTGRYLFTGSQTGVVCAYDLPQCITEVSENGQTCPSSHWRAHYDSTNGVSIHPSLPIIATSSGQRRIRQPTFKHPFKKQRTADMLEVQQSICNDTIPRHQSTLMNTDSESNSSSCDEKVLSDGEASVMITPVLVTGSTISSGESDVNPMVEELPLPLKGKLTLLPRENRLNLWSFPLSVTT
ncbi:hypothetical protein MN116_003681 [Schistosoma mekongi]|uniref:WD repeat-containing protein 79 n=1 Tax=Schistosoma mekongi TaxID=38744 RepID=A0AAE1ZE97_SCHME|nr:hypothetical protein MN116_003681 [Schistosoma mekongi]